MDLIALSVFFWLLAWVHNTFYVGPYRMFRTPYRTYYPGLAIANWVAAPVMAVGLIAGSVVRSKWRVFPDHVDQVIGNYIEYGSSRGLYSMAARRTVITTHMVLAGSLVCLFV